jgi:hypothetical protein
MINFNQPWYNRHDIYIKRIGFSLIRVYRLQKKSENVSTDEVLLSQLKWPVENMYAGLRPRINTQVPVWTEGAINTPVSGTNPNAWRDWHNMARLVDQNCDCVASARSLLPTTNADPTAITVAAAVSQTSQALAGRLTYTQTIKTLSTVKILAHGINIYADYNAEFFSDYLPYQYGGYNIVTPEDKGAIMVNFCLYPGTYQPSGHLNISRAREFYFTYTSAWVNESNPAELLVLAIAINFLLISDGSAVLRYST